MKKLNLDRIITYVTIAGWLITIGIGVNQIRGLMKDLETMQEQMFEQQQLNGKILMYIEMDIEDSE